MYVDLGIVVVALLLVIIFFRKLSSFVYAVAIIDIFFRIITFIKYNTVAELRNLVGDYFPESIASLIGKYSSGIIYTLLMWAYVIIFCIFLFYITEHFIKKKK